MFIELVDLLRCPARHEETWLVAAVESFHGRYIARGSLGCPICHAQFPVVDGAVHFAAPGPTDGTTRVLAHDVLRARALLDLTDDGGVVALAGDAAALVHALEEQAQVTILLLNPRGVTPAPGLSTVWSPDAVPMSASSLRGAMAGTGATPGMLEACVRALRHGGRLVAPVSMTVPEGVRELARDERVWVGQKAAPRESSPVTLRRSAP